MKRKESGDQGEAFAARYLESLGYEILERQWRRRHNDVRHGHIAALPLPDRLLVAGSPGRRLKL